jgi:GT2 family glycosyltransferase
MHAALPEVRTSEVDMNSDPVLSILLVSYNSRRYLEECLNSIRKYVKVPHEIVLVDNASADGTVGYVRAHFPNVQVVESERNLGFAGGNNRAAEVAKGKYLLLLNCDTILMSDIAHGIDVLERDPSIGVVGALMYGGSGEVRPNTGHFPHPWRLWKIGWLWSAPHTTPYGEASLSAFRHDWVEGSFLLTSRANWFGVGGMDENAFMYVEDVEFCAHTLHQGKVTVQCPDLKYVHFGGFDVSRTPLLYAGYRRFHANCSDRGTQLRADAVILTGLGIKLVVSAALSLLTWKQKYRERFKVFLDVAIKWKELAPKPPAACATLRTTASKNG